MLGLICDSGEVRGLFCKVVDTRGIPQRGSSPWAGLMWAAPRAARVGRVGEFNFLFHKELEIVFLI